MRSEPAKAQHQQAAQCLKLARKIQTHAIKLGSEFYLCVPDKAAKEAIIDTAQRLIKALEAYAATLETT